MGGNYDWATQFNQWDIRAQPVTRDEINYESMRKQLEQMNRGIAAAQGIGVGAIQRHGGIVTYTVNDYADLARKIISILASGERIILEPADRVPGVMDAMRVATGCGDVASTVVEFSDRDPALITAALEQASRSRGNGLLGGGDDPASAIRQDALSYEMDQEVQRLVGNVKHQ